MLRRLTWITVLPLLLAAAYFLADRVRELNARNHQDAERIAANMAIAVDNRLRMQIAALLVLADSPLADDFSRLEELYRAAQGLPRNLGTHVVFADMSRRILFHTRLPIGQGPSELSRTRGHVAVDEAIETGKPAVGDTLYGVVAKQNVAAVVVPVRRDGQTKALLISVLEVRRFQELFDTFSLPGDWTVTLRDGKGDLIAAHVPADRSEDIGLDFGAGHYVANSALSYWRVELDVPSVLYRGPVISAALTLAAGLAIATLIGFWGASVTGRRLARGVASLADPSAPAGRSSGIAEVDDARQLLTTAEAARDSAAERERESRHHFRATFEQAAVGIAHVAPDGGLIRVNERFCEITGRSREELLGRTFHDITHPDDLDRDVAQVGRLLTGELDTYSLEKRYLRPNGDVVWVNLTVSLVRDAEGAPDYFVSVIEDISERKALEGQLRQAQKMEAVGQLTGGLAHDFNNVLNVISMNVELLGLAKERGQPTEEYTDMALQAVRRAGEMTRKLLDFSRTEAGETRRVSVNGFVQGMERLIAKSLTPAIALEIVQAEDVWEVEINPGEFEAALLNLALNARDAMPEGGSLVIETANKVVDAYYAHRNPGSSAGDFVMVSVSDTGTGMAPDVASKAFDPFFTTKEVGRGTGLGLSMVYGFVRRSGGHVKIYTEVGEGTTIHMYLPRARGPAENREAPAEGRTSLPRGTETLLIVDDEEALIEAGAAALEGLGYRVLSATSGKEALEIIRQDPSIDLLFSDVIMPGGMDGYQLAVGALLERPGLGILLTSGFTRRREEFVNGERKIVAELARDLLPKPYNITELARAVRRVLDRPAREDD